MVLQSWKMVVDFLVGMVILRIQRTISKCTLLPLQEHESAFPKPRTYDVWKWTNIMKYNPCDVFEGKYIQQIFSLQSTYEQCKLNIQIFTPCKRRYAFLLVLVKYVIWYETISRSYIFFHLLHSIIFQLS